MAREYHFVVFYDEQTDSFELDYDTQDSKFQGSPIFDKDTGEWERLEPNHWADDGSVYNKAADLLYRTMQHLSLEEEN